MDYLTLPVHAVSELLLVFAVGVLVGAAIGYWQQRRDIVRRHEIVQRVIVPFEERFRSPLSARRWLVFAAARPAPRTPRASAAMATTRPPSGDDSAVETPA